MSIEKELALLMTTQTSKKPTPHVLVVDDEYFNFEMLTTAFLSTTSSCRLLEVLAAGSCWKYILIMYRALI